jgi:hypothetical protein
MRGDTHILILTNVQAYIPTLSLKHDIEGLIIYIQEPI